MNLASCASVVSLSRMTISGHIIPQSEWLTDGGRQFVITNEQDSCSKVRILRSGISQAQADFKGFHSQD